MLGFFLVVFAALLLAGGLYWRWRRKIAEEVAEGAEIEWAHFQKTEPEFLEGISEEKFREIYARVHTPRFPAYVLATFATFFLSLPVTFAILTGLLWAGQATGVVPQPVEMVQYVNLGDARVAESWQCGPECQLYIAEAFSGFYYFFGVIVAWLVIVWFFMRRYHKRRPGYLRDEIIRSREG
ncbi:hypothetical protein [Hyphococcus luteus]|uniref:Uncharacterized protein n=1 Tax=Hyphococcus luteus TaxID=2058213 RepID=A0A2S7K6E5_9PROT|nr:hypothetical protein [Marinicaulis flavus]PQA88049.1 hypothetical protein CW354_06870 [Marinicaulis flavus]